MRCEKASLLISAGLDGELEGNCAAQLRAHLAECALCSAEQEALGATVRLLRAVPEVDPPAELRRRIGGALLEIERRSEHRSLGFGWLLRSPAPGWAWGAAVGAAAGAALLVLTRGHSPAPRLAVVPSPPPSRQASLPPMVAAPVVSHPARKLHLTLKKPAAGQRPRTALPTLTADLLPAATPSPVAPQELHPPTASAPPARPHKTRPHVVHRFMTVARRTSPVVAPRLLNAHSALPGAPSSGSPGQFVDDSSRQAHTRLPSSPDSAAPSGANPDAPQDTTGMTEMASGGAMPSSPASGDDDLAELRRRLLDRPLQIPELGEQKPTESRRSNRDGWIRF
jgi:hypothetical protein